MQKTPWLDGGQFACVGKYVETCALSGSSLRVLIHLTRTCDWATGVNDRTQRQIAEACQLTERGVRKAIADLSAAGLVVTGVLGRRAYVTVVAPEHRNDRSSFGAEIPEQKGRNTGTIVPPSDDEYRNKRVQIPEQTGSDTGTNVSQHRNERVVIPEQTRFTPSLHKDQKDQIYDQKDQKDQISSESESAPSNSTKSAPKRKGSGEQSKLELRIVDADEWLELPATRKDRRYPGMPWRAYFEIKYPWFDGHNGRPSIADTARMCFDFYNARDGGLKIPESNLQRWIADKSPRHAEDYRKRPGYSENEGMRAHMRIVRATREKDYAGSSSWPAWMRSACGLSPEVGPEEKSNSEPLATPQGQQLPIASIEPKAPIAPNADTGEPFDFQAIIEKAMKKSRETAAAAFKHAGMDP